MTPPSHEDWTRWGVAAKQIGVSPSTVSRLITGVGDVSLEGAIAMLLWLDKPPTSEVGS
jgi:plasmid maintenance system antidote protein VapI